MKITIKETDYELNLGYRFSNALDKHYKIEQDIGNGQTIDFGAGVRFLYTNLSMGNFDAVVRFFNAGLAAHKKRPTEDAIIDAIEERAQEIGVDELADECIEALREAGFYKRLFAEQAEAEATE